MDKAAFSHKSVLLEETMQWLLTGNGLYIDGTLGGGGHAYEVLLRRQGTLLGIDRDEDALRAAKLRLSPFGDRAQFAKGNYADMKDHLREHGLGLAQGILLDLGVSSYQLDAPHRGFSYQHDAPLDMRMDQSQALSAGDVVNTYDERALSHVISAYGEEKWAARIAQFIVKARPVKTTFELVACITAAIPKAARRDGPHPARRTFQALRIEVNQELALLAPALRTAVECLEEGGRLCVITFHSLEDRIVKNTFRMLENPCTCPPKAPFCTCGQRRQVRVLLRKPIAPSLLEESENKRARSAGLRVCEKNITQ